MKPVWIVDDDKSIRWVLEKTLSREQTPFKSFSSASEALSQLDAGSQKKGGGKRRAEFSGDLGGVHGNKIKGASS